MDAHPLRVKLKVDYQSEAGQELYKKRGYLAEGYFAVLKKSRSFKGIERRGMKNAKKELTIQAIGTQP